MQETSAALSAVMKSKFPDHAVAITGRPNSIALAGISPNPSERCSESKISQAAISPRSRGSGSVSVITNILTAPIAAARITARSAG